MLVEPAPITRTNRLAKANAVRCMIDLHKPRSKPCGSIISAIGRIVPAGLAGAGRLPGTQVINHRAVPFELPRVLPR